MYSYEDIYDFLSEELSVSRDALSPNTDIHVEFGFYGDDAFDFEDKFADKFSVDISGYLWYFHHKEEGQNTGGIFFKPPNERVEHIAVTPQILLDSANTGKWSIEYPDHTVPKYRYDMLFNLLLTAIFVIVLILVFVYG